MLKSGFWSHLLSIIAQAYRVGGITSDALSAFAADNFTGGNITVVGSGIDHATLVALANESFGGVNAGNVENSIDFLCLFSRAVRRI